MYNNQLLSLALTFLTYVKLTTQDTLLFVATPGSVGNPSGLYGALVSNEGGDLEVREEYDFKFGYQCYHDNGAIEDHLELKSVAYDYVTGHVLLQKAELVPGYLTLFEGDVCSNGGGCKKRGPRVLFDKMYFQAKKPVTFGYHDREVYFLSQEKQSKEDGKTNIIELRKFIGCRDLYPVTSHKRFDLNVCSRKIATIISERGSRTTHEPMAGLRLVLLDDELFAFFTIQELIFNGDELVDIAVHLYSIRITPGFEENTILHLHQEMIGHSGYRKYIMSQLGNVDYKEDKLCWSTFDRILCADYFSPRHNIRRARYIVPPGAARDVVCKGQRVYANITTGVAIAEVINDEVRLFFGCMAGVSGTGGSGFVHMRHWETDVIPRPRAFYNVTSPLYSGQMFLSHHCKYMKHTKKKTTNFDDYALQRDQGHITVQASRSGATVSGVCWLGLWASVLWITV